MVRKTYFEKLTTETSASNQKPNNVCCESDSLNLKYTPTLARDLRRMLRIAQCNGMWFGIWY